MSSVLSSFAQPVTRKFVTIYNQTNSTNFVDYFFQSDFDTWFQANKQYISKISESMYIVNNNSPYTVRDLMNGYIGAPAILNYTGRIEFNKTIEDMSKEIRIGSLDDSEYVVFRKVRTPGVLTEGEVIPFTYGQIYQTGYVVVENNDYANDRPRFRVSVARV